MGRLYKNDRTFRNDNQMVIVIIRLFLVEMLFLLYAQLQGKGIQYLQIAVMLIPASVLTCILAYRIKADQYLLIYTLILLNFGFMVQVMVQTSETSMWKSAGKCLFAFGAAAVMAFLFQHFSHWISMDAAIPVFICIQFILLLILFFFGQVVGEGEQEALLNLKIGPLSVQPLEMVKLLYIFVVTSILCKDDCRNKKILGLSREVVVLLYTAFTGLSIIFFKEFGSLLIILLAGCGMFFIYCHNNKLLKRVIGTGIIMTISAVLVCILFHKQVPALNKIYLRFQYLWKPEQDAYNAGYQYIQIRKALPTGGILGPDTRRYLFQIPQENNDLIFCKLVQTCGIVMGLLLIAAIMLMLRQGYMIAKSIKDSYYSGLAMGMTLIIGVESLVHLGYNTCVFPITGLPLYYVSEGFSSTTMGLVMTGFLLVISTGTQERSIYDEKVAKRYLQKVQRYFPRKR